jgi:hypothetical protein
LFCLLQYSFILIADGIERCSGGTQDQVGSCCTATKPCEVNQGDCDDDEQCKGNLVCGENNCEPKFTWTDADCCVVKTGKLLFSLITSLSIII